MKESIYIQLVGSWIEKLTHTCDITTQLSQNEQWWLMGMQKQFNFTTKVSLVYKRVHEGYDNGIVRIKVLVGGYDFAASHYIYFNQ